MIHDQPRVAGMNMLLTDERKSYALEITDSDVQVCEPEDDVVVRHAAGEGPTPPYSALVICPQDRTVWASFNYPCAGIEAVARPTG